MFRRTVFQVGSVVVVCFCSGLLSLPQGHAEDIRFTSVPDIFNWNIRNPQPGWEETLDWFFDRLQKDGPDFTLNAGDIMDARWWDDEAQVKTKTDESAFDFGVWNDHTIGKKASHAKEMVRIRDFVALLLGVWPETRARRSIGLDL